MPRSREQLPTWARAALDDFDQAVNTGGDHDLRLGTFWHFEAAQLGFWSRAGYQKRPVAGALGVGWLLGLGFLGWAVFGLRSEELVLWAWIVGAALSLIGALGLAIWKRSAMAPAREGLLLAPAGLVEVGPEGFECIAREDVEAGHGRLRTRQDRGGEDNHFAFAMREEASELKIFAWNGGDCRRNWWR